MASTSGNRLTTGVPAIDTILGGGLLPRRGYLVRGSAGAGKTTLGFHFLAAGKALGERSLFVSLGESEQRLRENAEAQGFDLSDVAFLDLSPSPELFSELEDSQLFSHVDTERGPLTRRIHACVEEVKPTRVFIDPLSQLRHLSTSAHHFRRQTLAFLNFLHDRGVTALFSSELQEEDADAYLRVLADGVFDLFQHEDRRTFEVKKLRGSDFRAGPHSLRLTDHGMKVFPRLIPEDYGVEFQADRLSSGIPELDAVLFGGIERGTVTLITGPTGVGKTTLGIQFMKEAAGRGEHSVVYSFEEQAEIMLCRCEALNIPARKMIERGTLTLRRVEPLGMTADEFAADVRQQVEERHARIVMIDSIAGYRLTLKGGDLVQHLHALCKYLQNMGVAVLLINEVEGVSGTFRVTDFKISYLADNIVFLRYMEHHGKDGVQLRKIIGVLKKRLTDFDNSVHELEFSRYGVKVGGRLTGVTSILSEMPIWRPEGG